MAKNTLTVYLTAKIYQLRKGLSEARKAIGRLKNYVVSAAGVGGIGLSFVGAVAAAKSLVDKLDGIGKASGNLGITTERYQKLAYAARRTNTSMQMVEMAMMKARKLSGDLAVGNAEAAKTFNLLGLRAEDLKTLKTDQMFDRIATSLQAIDDPLKRSAVQAKLFGESGEQLNNFLRDYNTLGAEAARRGMIIKAEEVKKAEDLKDAIENLNTAMTALAANTGFVGWMNRVAEGIEALLENDKNLKKAGMLDRQGALEYVINRAKASGRYSEYDLKRMESASYRYANRLPSTSAREEDSFLLIDKALKEFGIASMARVDTGQKTLFPQANWNFWADFFQGDRFPTIWYGRQRIYEHSTLESFDRPGSASDLLKRGKLLNEKAASSASSKEEAARVESNRRQKEIEDAAMMAKGSALADIAVKTYEAQEAYRKNREEQEAASGASFRKYLEDMRQKMDSDRLRNTGRMLDADLFDKVNELRSKGIDLDSRQTSLLRALLAKQQKPLESVRIPAMVNTVIRGNLDAYQAKINAGTNKNPQLKVQQDQLSAQNTTNELIGTLISTVKGDNGSFEYADLGMGGLRA